MPSIQPFRFEGLPKLTRQQVALQESLAVHLSYRPFTGELGGALGKSLEPYLKERCQFSAPELRVLAKEQLTDLVPKVGCFVVVGAAPVEQKIIVDIDRTLVALCIERLLGGKGAGARVQRPLTEIEEGVFSFVILQVLAHFHSHWDRGQELALGLDRFASGLDGLQPLLTDSHYHVLGFRCGIGNIVGYARVFVPASLITKNFSTPLDQAGGTPEEIAYMRRLLAPFGERELEGRVQFAQLDLQPDDIAALEIGDIVLLENHQVKLAGQALDGQAILRFGRAENGHVVGRIVNEGEVCKLEVTQIVITEKPTEETMADTQESDNLAETAGLLRDVPAPVVVELGRIKLNTNQIIRLRAGNVLRLPRGPNDPVNLVVNDKLFARGELVEVDGELGVRLIQVAGGT